MPERSSVLVGAAAGILAGAGAYGGHVVGGAGRATATVVVGWLALTYALVLADSPHPYSSVAPEPASVTTTMSTGHLPLFVDQAMLAFVVLTIASLATHSFERSAAEMLLAAPLGLTLYVVTEGISATPSAGVRACVRCAACGSAAALFSSQALSSEPVSTPLLAGLLLLALLGLIIARRTRERTVLGSAVPTSAWLIAAGVAALATGIAANLLALLSIAAPAIFQARAFHRSSNGPARRSSPPTAEATTEKSRSEQP